VPRDVRLLRRHLMHLGARLAAGLRRGVAVTVYAVFFAPKRPRRLKAGGALMLLCSVHTTAARAEAARAKCERLYACGEGSYVVEPWMAT
jgi:hypothetical protein